ncbi:MAG: bifunctional nuclease family protein [Muribaculaceae bacterium]|nr:bifunctional nuclease family protein [Muribaculaceae bacterium]
MEKIRLKLVGVTYNQIESGVYAVVLQEADGNRRIPIIIGFPEAQAIECKLQEVITPRPLTHDLMVNMLSSFGVSLQEVNIYKMDNGVFGAELILTDGIDRHILDSRSSDAIALAIRVGAPIFTSPVVLKESGFDPQPASKAAASTMEEKGNGSPSSARERMTPGEVKNRRKQLQKEMQSAAEAENYEEAARIKGLLDKLDEKYGQ